MKAYLKKYRAIFERKLGMNDDDILNDLREEVWKALLTFRPEAGVKLTTYVNKLIHNRIYELYKKCTLKKHSHLDYFSDVFSIKTTNNEEFQTDETPQTIFEVRERWKQKLADRSHVDQLVISGVLSGMDLTAMEKKFQIDRVTLTRSIKEIAEFVEKFWHGDEEIKKHVKRK